MENNNFLQDILDFNQIGFLIANQQLIVQKSSPHVENLITLENTKLLNNSLSDLFIELTGLEEHLLQVFNQKNHNEILYELAPITRITHNDSRYYKLVIRKYHDQFLLVIQDITTMAKEFQDTTQISHENILLKNKLKKTIENRNRYFSYLVHDLRNPVNTTNLVAEMLDAETPDDHPHKALIKFIFSSSALQLENIRSVLSLSKFDSDYININPSTFELDLLVNQIFKSQALLAKDKNLSLENNIPASFFINSDLIFIETILTNLINNSIKFTDEGKIEVFAEADKQHIKIFVSDTGSGISDQKKQNIFNLQYIMNSFNNISKTGIGLGIVKKLTDLLNGEVSFEEPRLDCGTTIMITLPVDISQAQ